MRRNHVAPGQRRPPEDPLNDLQAKRFTEMLAEAPPRGVDFEVAHLSNSPSAMTRPDLAFDMVRPGIAVYGLSPIPDLGDMGLRPAMTLKCTVAMVKPVQAGEESLTAQVDRRTRHQLGAVTGRVCRRCLPRPGRADRCADHGRLRRSVGRICMDQFVVDLGPGEPDVAEGDEAILFGPGTSGELTAQDWADLLGTIHYEVVTSPRGRVVRSYREADAGGD